MLLTDPASASPTIMFASAITIRSFDELAKGDERRATSGRGDFSNDYPVVQTMEKTAQISTRASTEKQVVRRKVSDGSRNEASEHRVGEAASTSSRSVT